MEIQHQLEHAAKVAIERKRAALVKMLENADDTSRKFIAAQMCFLEVERQTILAAGQLLTVQTTHRHIGMALAQATAEPLNIIAHTGELLGEAPGDLLSAFFGRLDEITPVVFEWAMKTGTKP